MSHVRKATGLAVAAVTAAATLVPLIMTSSAGAANLPTPAGFQVHQQTVTTPNCADGDAQVGNELSLSWSPVPGANGYDVQISADARWDDADSITVPDGHSTAPAYVPPVDLPHATYYWRVRADIGSSQSAWTQAPGTFTRAWLDCPASPTSTTGKRIELSWQPLRDASYYEIEFSESPSFADAAPVQGSNDKQRCYTTHTAMNFYVDRVGKEVLPSACTPDNPMTLDYGTTYYWRVRGRNGTSATATQPTAPSSGAGTATSTAPTYDTTGNAVCTGVWHAKDVDTYNVPATPECSLWSDTKSFTVPAPALGVATALPAPTGLTSTCGSQCSDTPVLAWNDVTGAEFFRVSLGYDRAMTNITHIFDVYDTRLLEASALPDEQKVQYWTVQSCVSVPGSTTTTVTAAPVTPPTAPATMVMPGEPVLLTATVTPTDAVGQVEFFDGPTSLGMAPLSNGKATFVFNQSTAPATVAKHNLAAVFRATPNTSFPDSYSTPVTVNVSVDGATAPTVDTGSTPAAPKAPAGSQFDCSVAAAPQPYPTKQSLPVQLSAPDDGTAVTDVYPTLQWNDYLATGSLTEAREYRLEVATDDTFAHPIDDRIVDLTSYTAQKAYPDTMIWWRVAAIDESGNRLAWSTPRWFVFGRTARVSTSVDSASPLLQQAWDTVRSSAALGGRYAVSQSKADRMTYSFAGSTAKLYGTRLPTGGYADVYVDGTHKATVSFYSSTVRYRQVVWSGSLTPGHHLLVVVVRGTHPRGSKGSTVAVDGLRTASGTMQESAAVMRWSTHRATDAYRGSFAVETGFVSAKNHLRPRATTKLYGSQVLVYGCKGPDSGKMGVWIDGHYMTTVDLYQSYTACDRPIFTSTRLAQATHTVVIEPLGTSRPGHHGTRVALDRLMGR